MKTDRRINIIITDDVVLPSNVNDLRSTNIAASNNLIVIIAASSSALVLILITIAIVAIYCKRKRQVR